VSLEGSIGVRLPGFDLDVEIEVAPGELLAILGPNGAGKSTLLRSITGLAALDHGRLQVDGVLLDDPAADVFVAVEQRPVGMVFQTYLLFDHLSAADNVAFGLRARGMHRTAARQRALDWLERVGLADYVDARPASLSGGQAQRVALARALATEPRVLLLDEPLAALDVQTRREVRRDLREHLASFDGMRLLVTHDPVDAYALADRVAILDGGRIVQTGTIAAVTAHPRSRYVADLVGTNLVIGTVEHGTLVTDTGARVVATDAPAGRSFAVIRPQAVVLSGTDGTATSARNSWLGTVQEIDILGDRARVSTTGVLPLIAEITVAAVDALGLRPGDEVYATVKATDIETYPA
jgi:molybdate transport system ATP-binding protein